MWVGVTRARGGYSGWWECRAGDGAAGAVPRGLQGRDLYGYGTAEVQNTRIGWCAGQSWMLFGLSLHSNASADGARRMSKTGRRWVRTQRAPRLRRIRPASPAPRYRGFTRCKLNTDPQWGLAEEQGQQGCDQIKGIPELADGVSVPPRRVEAVGMWHAACGVWQVAAAASGALVAFVSRHAACSP